MLKILVYIFILGLYTRHEISFWGITIPFPLCLFSGTILGLINFKKINPQTTKYLLLFWGGAILISLIDYNSNFFIEKIKGIIQLSFTFVASYGLYLGVVEEKSVLKSFSKGAFAIIVIILFFSMAELIPVVFDFSNNLKLFLFKLPKENLEYQLSRNTLVGAGIIRPFPLATEPSYVALFYNVITFLWLWTATLKNKKFVYLGLVIVGALLFRSLHSVWGLFNGIVYIFVKERNKFFSKKNLVIIIFLLSFVVFMLFVLLSKRTEAIINNAEPSFGIRVVISFQLLLLALKFFPIFGVGLLNNEWLVTKYSETFNNQEFFNTFITGHQFIINNFCAHFAYFGIIGGSILLYLLYKFFKLTNGENVFIIFYFVIMLSLSLGSYAGQMFWGYLFLISAIMKKEKMWKNAYE